MAFQQKRAELAETDGMRSVAHKFSANLADDSSLSPSRGDGHQPSPAPQNSASDPNFRSASASSHDAGAVSRPARGFTPQFLSGSAVKSKASSSLGAQPPQSGLIDELFGKFKLSTRDQFIIDRTYLKLKWTPQQLKTLATKFSEKPESIKDYITRLGDHLKEKFALTVPDVSVHELATSHPNHLVFQFKDQTGKISNRVFPPGTANYQKYSLYQGLVMESVAIAETFFASRQLANREPAIATQPTPSTSLGNSDPSLGFTSTVASVPTIAKRFSL